MGSDLSPRFGACSFDQNQERGKYQRLLIRVLSARVVVVHIVFPGNIWALLL